MIGFNVPDVFMDAIEPWGTTIGVICVLGLWSMLYKENPFYRICEHAYVGSAAAHTLVTTFANTIKPGLQVNMAQNGDWWELIPIVLGCLIYFQPVRRFNWLSRYPMAFWVGYNAGYNLTLRVAMPLILEARRTMLPWFVMTDGSFNLGASLSNIIFSGTVLLVFAYFIFTKEAYQGKAAFLNRWTRLAIMVCFGAGFGNGVANRVSLLIGRFNYILSEWLALY
ncbi:MAG: hypothetical protein FWF06_08555 [Symbiobacteriaceae bacterium]|nr:hypothetical protein [Symbiobacteriaceae bacterium]